MIIIVNINKNIIKITLNFVASNIKKTKYDTNYGSKGRWHRA